MARHGAIRKGDRHSGGGRMIEGRGVLIDGVPQCVLGDRAACALHGGEFALVSSADNTVLFNDIPLVFEPAQLACGCSVLSSCRPSNARA
ncbi:PAAR domain-containing protein [Pseudomonas sp. BW13M1]|uniref:PAAR domain-containing protein n=1 Tax=Pseudomonas peradeniyensis TaxID=2745488 RepID=A0A923K2R7_9PSED|nr:PAAR domain-containing protein [Pseudomonas peradeniyensis]MBV4504781.1 PAAR domain-containing protein [Pseudomonas peradeniyensis]